MRRDSSGFIPQVLFAATLLLALGGFGVLFDRLADAIDLQPAAVEMRLLPSTAHTSHERRPR